MCSEVFNLPFKCKYLNVCKEVQWSRGSAPLMLILPLCKQFAKAYTCTLTFQKKIVTFTPVGELLKQVFILWIYSSNMGELYF